MAIGCFLSLESYSSKLQAQLIANEVMSYYYEKGTTPSSLNEIFYFKTMYLTPTLKEYSYSKEFETDEYCVWKLHYTDIWGKGYFYDDKTGVIEHRYFLIASKQENWMIK